MNKRRFFYLFLNILLFILILNMNVVSALPHTIWGYAVYEDGNYPKDADIIAYNKNLDEYANITIGTNGTYNFDVGTPGKYEWNDGDEIEIIIIQKNQGEYLDWMGNGSIIIDFNFSTQQVIDIILYSPEGNNGGNNVNINGDKNNDNGFYNNFIYLIILIILIVIVAIFVLKRIR